MPTAPFPPPIVTLGNQLRSGATTVTAEIAAAGARIDRLNARFRAFSHLAPVTPATADALDAELRAGRARGPLHGITASVKGNIPVAGLPWTEGSRLFAARRAESDAGIVARLRAAGSVVLGEAVPSGVYGGIRIFAFAAVTLGAILLVRPEGKATQSANAAQRSR